VELSAKYEIKVYYKLPDGSDIDINRIVNFSLEKNYRVIDNILAGSLYFDDTSNGCLILDFHDIEKCFFNLNIIDSWCLILDRELLVKHLTKFRNDARTFLKDKDSIIRDLKLKLLTE
jgi:hypothetical protein